MAMCMYVVRMHHHWRMGHLPGRPVHCVLDLPARLPRPLHAGAHRAGCMLRMQLGWLPGGPAWPCFGAAALQRHYLVGLGCLGWAS